MIAGLYTHAATFLIACAVAATGACLVQNWRYKANGIKAEKAMQQERESWQAKVSSAEKATREQQDANRANADKANAEHSAAMLSMHQQLKGAQREINRLSDNLSACRLSPDLVRLLNNQRAAILAPASKD